MSATATGKNRPLGDVVDAVRQSLQTEQNRSEIERDAFEEFASRIADLQPSSTPTVSTSGHDVRHRGADAVGLKSQPVAGPRATNGLGTIRTAYENTVMSVPFYDTEYGDTYEESIRAEFGPNIATALTRTVSLTPGVKRVLLGKVEQARREREALIETCNREHESVDTTAAVLEPIDEELQSVEAISFHNQGFGQLEAHRARLLTIEDKCEDAATTRQATIHQHRTAYDHPTDAPDICVYLYDEFESTYPILWLCSDLARRIDDCRRQVERAMSINH